jgi:uroporphyrinogen decarboxylase
VVVNEWGIRRKWISHDSGGYWEYVDFPLKNASEGEVMDWPMPSPDDYDYSHVADMCSEYGSFAVYTGGPGLCDVINKNGMLRGTEQALVDLIMEDPVGLLLAKRRTDVQLQVAERTITAAKGGIDFLWMGEDLGTQNGPMISPDLYRKVIRPFHEKFVGLAKAYHLPVMIHSCGSSSWAFEDFVDMGVTAVDTLQPEAKDMKPGYLKATYGDHLAFHGCISTAGTVSFGSEKEVISECRRTLEVMMPGGGYCLAPTHQLQDNSPTENVIAMYNTAKKYGVY